MRIRIRDLFWGRDPGCKNSDPGFGIQNKHSGSAIRCGILQLQIPPYKFHSFTIKRVSDSLKKMYPGTYPEHCSEKNKGSLHCTSNVNGKQI
jgi:hypothetical protein